MIRQGYNFDGLKARHLKAQLERCRRDPDYARALFGLPPREDKRT